MLREASRRTGPGWPSWSPVPGLRAGQRAALLSQPPAACPRGTPPPSSAFPRSSRFSSAPSVNHQGPRSPSRPRGASTTSSPEPGHVSGRLAPPHGCRGPTVNSTATGSALNTCFPSSPPQHGNKHHRSTLLQSRQAGSSCSSSLAPLSLTHARPSSTPGAPAFSFHPPGCRSSAVTVRYRA